MRSDCNTSISKLESALAEIGYGSGYCAVIRQKVTKGASTPYLLHCYKAALERTLRSKQKIEANPF